MPSPQLTSIPKYIQEATKNEFVTYYKVVTNKILLFMVLEIPFLMALVYFFAMYPESTDGGFPIIGGAMLLQSLLIALVMPNFARDTIVITETGITSIRGWFFHFTLAKHTWSDFSGEISDGDIPVFYFTEERKQRELQNPSNKNKSSDGLQFSHFQLPDEILDYIKGKIKK